MAKSSPSKDRPGRIEIQKGPVSMDEQYSLAFSREPDRTMEDMRNLQMSLKDKVYFS
jgi:hypothetical protein